VVSQEQLPAKTTKIILTQLREHALGLPVFLVVNKASGEAAADIANAEKILSEWGVLDTVLGIYHAPYQKAVHDRTLWPVFTDLAGAEISGVPAGLDASDLGKAYFIAALTLVIAEMRKDIREAAAIFVLTAGGVRWWQYNETSLPGVPQRVLITVVAAWLAYTVHQLKKSGADGGGLTAKPT
jgi:hypothetical protein